jgi:hypothetical protein
MLFRNDTPGERKFSFFKKFENILDKESIVSPFINNQQI